ncbi:MAG: carbohydrate-binding protein [Lachnospiraceae bacterium]|jgi:hypothetical protein
MDLCFKILDVDMNIKAVSRGVNEVSLVYTQAYAHGDRIILETSGEEGFVWIQMDDAIGKGLVYITGNVEYIVPFEEQRSNLSPKAFYGNRHLLHARAAKDYDVEGYRNLSLNIYDQYQMKDCFPHAVTNVETRGKTVFAAQNAIDGVVVNNSYGEWPYQSWGIDRKEDALIKIEFGRTVAIDCIVLYTRADFPHDNWWKSVHFTFSDGSELDMEMEKSELPSEITFPMRQVKWLEMNHMVKSEDASPFPALTQIEVYGIEVGNSVDFVL